MDFELTKEQKKHIEDRCEFLIKKHVSLKMNEYDRNMKTYQESLGRVDRVFDDLNSVTKRLRAHGSNLMDKIIKEEFDDRVRDVIKHCWLSKNMDDIREEFQDVKDRSNKRNREYSDLDKSCYEFNDKVFNKISELQSQNNRTKYFCIAVALMIAVNFLVSW